MTKLSIVMPTISDGANIIDRLREIEISAEIAGVSESSYEVLIVQNNMNSSFKSKTHRVAVNSFNIGAPANVISAFARAVNEWVWVVSDNDRIHEDALSHIFRVINHATKEGLICFGRKSCVQDEQRYVIHEFIDCLTNFSEQISLGNCIYKNDLPRSVTETLMHYNSSMCPQFVLALECLRKNPTHFLSSSILVEPVPIDFAQQWSYLNAFMNFTVVCSHPALGYRNSIALERIIWRSLPRWQVLIGSIIFVRLNSENGQERALQVLHTIYKNHRIRFFVGYQLLRLLILAPKKCNNFILYMAERWLGRTITVRLPM